MENHFKEGEGDAQQSPEKFPKTMEMLLQAASTTPDPTQESTIYNSNIAKDDKKKTTNRSDDLIGSHRSLERLGKTTTTSVLTPIHACQQNDNTNNNNINSYVTQDTKDKQNMQKPVMPAVPLPSLAECGLLMRKDPQQERRTHSDEHTPRRLRLSVEALLNGPCINQSPRPPSPMHSLHIAANPHIPLRNRFHAPYTTSHPVLPFQPSYHAQAFTSQSASVSPMMYSANITSPIPDYPRTPSSAGVHVCSHPGCGKSFPSRSRLHRHMIVHTNEKPFMCPFEGCGRRFSRRDNMLQHYKSHRNKR